MLYWVLLYQLLTYYISDFLSFGVYVESYSLVVDICENCC